MNMKLIKNTENISKEKITLFCLPFAGGGASAYNQWAKKMQGKVTVCPVQLPAFLRPASSPSAPLLLARYSAHLPKQRRSTAAG